MEYFPNNEMKIISMENRKGKCSVVKINRLSYEYFPPNDAIYPKLSPRKPTLRSMGQEI